jgi:hypothetical protein
MQMKSLVPTFLSVLLMTCLIGCGASSEKVSKAESKLAGDLNGDRTINAVDLQCMSLVQKWAILGQRATVPICLRQRMNADLNCDGRINVLDLQILAKLATGKALPSAIDRNGNGKVDDCEAPRKGHAKARPNKYGDINADGRVDVNDLQCLSVLKQVFTGGAFPKGPICLADRSYADLNCDGKINVIDLTLLGKVVTGLPLNKSIDANSDGIHDNCHP